MKKCKCEHWQTCPVCYPQGFDEAGNRKPVEIPPTRDEMLARIKELEAERDDLLLRVQQFDHHVSAIGHHIGAVCGGVDVDPEVEGSTAAAIIAKFDEKKERIAELTRIIAGLRVELAQAKLYMPGRRAEPMPKTEHGEFCKKYWWNQTDEEFAASGKPYVEVTG